MKKTGIRELCSKENREKWVLFATTLYIFARILSYSLLSEITASILFKPVYILCYLLAGAKICLDLLNGNYRIKEICIIGALSIFLFFNMQIISTRQAFIYWVFIIASRGVNYKKILKWAAIAHFAALIIVIGGSCLHFLDNVIYQDGSEFRESLGFAFTSQPINFYFYAVILWLAAREKKITYPELIGLILIDCWLYTKTLTLNAFIFTTAALSIILLIKIFPIKWHKGFQWIAVLVPLLAAGLVIILSVLYDPTVSWMNTVNQLVHSRLNLGHTAIEKYGIPIWGQYIDWIGATRTHVATYNYVDSSFVQILLNNGWVFFTLMMVGLVRFGKAISDHGNVSLLIVFCMAILHATFDPQLTWIMFNSLWLAYTYVEEKTEGQKPIQGRAWKRIKYAAVTFFLVLIISGTLIPACGAVLNRALLLNPKLTGYYNVLLNARAEYIKAEETYLLTWANKAGFGEVTPEDMKFFTESSQRMYPDISRTTLCFTDGTGIEITSSYAVYGKLDEKGKVIGDAREISLDALLKSQIEGITTYLREYDAAGNIIYQYQTDAEGNGIVDNTGNAGFRRTYDARHRILTEVKVGVDGMPLIQPEGYGIVRYEYEEGNNNWTRIQYLDLDGNMVMITDGYAESRRVFLDNIHVAEQRYFDENGYPVNVSLGYTCVRNEYKDGKLSLTYYENVEGNVLDLGSFYLHKYLQGLKGKTVFISIKDEGTRALSTTIMEDLRALGIQTDLMGKSRNSYYAVIAPEGIVEDISAEQEIGTIGKTGDFDYSIKSAGYTVGNYSSIIINGQEYSKNVRGMNIVVIESGNIKESIAFDTYDPEIRVTR